MGDRSTRELAILSPHIDDSVLSLGAHIFELRRRNIEVRVINCFSQSPYAPMLPKGGDCDTVTSIRTEEDRLALRYLGVCRASIVNLNFRDAEQRGVPDADFLHPERAFRVNGPELVVQLASQLKKQCPHAGLLVPLAGANTHIDHKIATCAALLATSHRVVGVYADAPYSFGLSLVDCSRRLVELETAIQERFYPCDLHSLAGLATKRLSAAKYRSQIDLKYLDLFLKSSERIGGERLWVSSETLSQIPQLP